MQAGSGHRPTQVLVHEVMMGQQLAVLFLQPRQLAAVQHAATTSSKLTRATLERQVNADLLTGSQGQTHARDALRTVHARIPATPWSQASADRQKCVSDLVDLDNFAGDAHLDLVELPPMLNRLHEFQQWAMMGG